MESRLPGHIIATRIALVVVDLLLLLVFWGLYRSGRERYLAVWSVAFLLLALQATTHLTVLAGVPFVLADTVGQLLDLGAAALAIVGAFTYLRRRAPLWMGAILVLVLLWSVLGGMLGLPALWSDMPANAFVGAALAVTGIMLLRWANPGMGRATVGSAFLLYSVFAGAPPLMELLPGYEDWRLMVDLLFLTGLGLGVLLMHFEHVSARAAQAALRFQSLFDHAAEGIFRMERGGRITEANPALGRMLDAEPDELRERSLYDLFASPVQAGLVRSALGDGAVDGEDCVWVRVDGSPLRVELSASPLGTHGELIQGSVRDVTFERAARAGLERSQRLEALGRLAGGIAHDFNNALTSVLASVSFLGDSLESEEHTAELAAVEEAVQRAAGLTRQLLAFARHQALDRHPVDLGVLARSTGVLLRRVLGEEITLVEVHEPTPLWVLAEPAQLEQILMNLALNARDAMSSGGHLRVETRGHASGVAELVVEDDGAGMDEATLARAFDPFFSTKGATGGSGLGLTSVRGIVEQLGGGITLDSSPGEGTRVVVDLPTCDPPSEEEITATHTDGKVAARILVVEDQAPVRRAVVRALEKEGHVVIMASSGAEALELTLDESIDLVVSDVVMPGMSGPELVEVLRRSMEHLPALFLSGFTSDRLTQLPEDSLFLAKPFSPGQLAEMVQRALDRAQG